MPCRKHRILNIFFKSPVQKKIEYKIEILMARRESKNVIELNYILFSQLFFKELLNKHFQTTSCLVWYLWQCSGSQDFKDKAGLQPYCHSGKLPQLTSGFPPCSSFPAVHEPIQDWLHCMEIKPINFKFTPWISACTSSISTFSGPCAVLYHIIKEKAQRDGSLGDEHNLGTPSV